MKRCHWLTIEVYKDNPDPLSYREMKTPRKATKSYHWHTIRLCK